MNSKEIILSNNVIKNKIYTIRGKQVILDRDLAEFYDVQTGQLNRVVKRNKERFPNDFCFQLNNEEFFNLKCQNGISSFNTKKIGGTRKLPYVFTEYGVAMLSGILKSKIAIQVSISIMKAFVAMRHLLLENANILQKFQQIDQKLIDHDGSINKIFNLIEEKYITPKQGIFFEGQIFNAHKFIVNLIKQAKKEIILIDNYVDESVLTQLSNKKKGVFITIYTANLTDKIILAKDKFNKQYNNLKIKKFNKSHDRFLIIDKQAYHIGASIKDAGKKWFAFNKIEKESIKILDNLN